MKVCTHLAALRREQQPIFLAAGFFDGVHRGHQRVLAAAWRAARRQRGQVWVLTFQEHPLQVLRPDTAPRLLTSPMHKLRLLERHGVDGCLLLPFTRRLATLEPNAFFALLGRSIPSLRAIFVGADWRFGRRRRGTVSSLRRQAVIRGIRVEALPPVCWQGAPISSTRIRAAIAHGRLAAAARMLGQPFSLLGTVIPGRRLGRKLGFPTANFLPGSEVCPPHGVYAVRATLGQRSWDGMLNFGVHPTVGRVRRPQMELHLFDTRVRLYHRILEVFFCARLRSEHTFDSPTALIAALHRDAAIARQRLAAVTAKKLWKNTLHRGCP